MDAQKVQVRFGGLGGQGLVTLGAVLAEAAARSGMRVAASQQYGSRARGGATRADVILAREEIDFPHIHRADVLLVLAQEAYELYLPSVTEAGLVLADPFFVKLAERGGRKQLLVPATATAIEKVGKQVAANFVLLGALLGYTELVPDEAVRAAIAKLVNPRFQAINLEACSLGAGLGRALAEEVGPWR
ncbi:MAG: 2-oxoacid:acceptor oxidoreductase family protein [Deltaproteobacteria bacterium]|nr:2-oxoacid:acceptor oxidoreductase family protein [Deltaproteobacteria bacterium]